ncbi:MAG: T9SS type A sorting domain-containing protein [Ignavibacteria bacterium]|nr:T9SS type A sorting domain-containing protein [Ignavibacteria bacterium]
MKIKLLLSLFIVLVFSLYAGAQVNLTENFDYPAGDSLGAHGWTGFSNFNNVLTVTSPGLSYTGYSGSGIGNAVTILNYGQDAYKPLTTPDTAGNVYVSFMVKIDSAKTSGDYFFALLPSTSTTLYIARIFTKDTNGVVKFGLIKSTTTGGSLYYTTGTYQYGVTYLIILKYVFNTGSTTDDEMYLHVLTSPNLPATEPTPAIGPVTGTQSDASNIGRVALRQGSSSSSPTLVLDGIKVTKTWQSVVSNIKFINEIANDFSLSQNYPNPFNPSTTIKFSIPSNGYVNLNVFNTLGQEVKTLVSGQLPAGTYNADFNGSNLTSGVYFYRLNYTDNNGKQFSDVKKLMLIK